MGKIILSKEKVDEVLSRANYWNEVNKRSSGVDEILYSELRDVVGSLGLSVLWVLEEYAKEARLIYEARLIK